jgi:hypothetical protein
MFLLCAEGLSVLFHKAGFSGNLKGIQSCPRGPWVSHLFFANDSLLFGQATLSECRKIMDILGCYERCSGQKIKRDKTAIFFSHNTSNNSKQSIQDF